MGLQGHTVPQTASASPQHGDRKGPPGPTQPPSPLLYDVGAAMLGDCVTLEAGWG